MKKIYMTPTLLVEQTENDDMLMASGNGGYYLGGGDSGEKDEESGSTSTADGDNWNVGAKGNFAFCEDFEYSIDM